MLEIQIQLLTAWWHATSTVRQRLDDAHQDDRGEITATTALIVLLVVAAIAAGGVIASKIAANANNVPTP
jgi:succinate dehydrogenase hydrophobic anchor subunit